MPKNINFNDTDLDNIFDNIDFNEPIDDIEKELKKNRCANCQDEGTILNDIVQGQLVCTACGQVSDNTVLDSNPEWKMFDDTVTARCSSSVNVLLPQSSFNTTISGYYNNHLKRLQSWNLMPYKEKSLYNVFKLIHAKCEEGKMPKCIEDDSKIMYKKLSECKHMTGKNKNKMIIVRGDNRLSLIAACIFFACKRKLITRSPKELAKLFGLKYTVITRGCKFFLKYMKYLKKDVDVVNDFSLNTNQMVSIPSHFIEKFTNELKIKDEYKKMVLQIATNSHKLNIASDHTPYSIASASILLMSEINNLDITKKHISSIAKISDVTILKTYYKLIKFKDILINEQLVDNIVNKINSTLQNITVPQHLIDRLNNINKNNNISYQSHSIALTKNIENLDNSYSDTIARYSETKTKTNHYIDMSTELAELDNKYNNVINRFNSSS